MTTTDMQALCEQAIAALASRPDAQAGERYDLLQAAVNCPHEIESNRVVLHYSDKQPGHNALAQLRERLVRAAGSSSKVADEQACCNGSAPAHQCRVECGGTMRAAGTSQADERVALMCERLRAMGLNTATEAADLIEQMARAAVQQPSQDEVDLCERVIHAVEGECDGLAITEEQASNILAYLQYGVPMGDMSESFRIVDNAIGAVEDNEPDGGNLRIVTLRIDAARQVRAALAAVPQAEAAQGVPEGYALMPIDPTIEMLMLVYDPGAEEAPSERYKKLLSLGAGAPYPDREQAPYSAPFTTDVPHCCGEPETCNDPCDASPSRECGEPPAENAGVRNKIAAALHYPDHWDTAAYPTLDDAVWEAIASAKLTCSECAEQPSELGEQGSDMRKALQWVAGTLQTIVSGRWRDVKEGDRVSIGATVKTISDVLDMADEALATKTTQQECPHGVDDGACKQCYGEATFPRGFKVKHIEGHGWIIAPPSGTRWIAHEGTPAGELMQALAASAPTKAEAKCKACNGNDGDMPCAYPEGRADCLRNASAPALTTERDAFENWWNAKLAAGEASIDIAFNLFVELTADSAQPQAAEPPTHWRDKPQNIALLAVERGDPVDCDGTFACPICGKDEPHQHSSEEIAKFRTTQPQATEPKGMTEEQLCAVQCAEEALRAIAERGHQIGDTIEPINDIRAASSRAAAALKRFAPVARDLLAKGE